MKIAKYNQSCLLIETNNKRILIDPGVIGYYDGLLNKWKNIDIILVTHKHQDHCNKEAIEEIIKRDNSKLYITDEIQKEFNFVKYNIIKENNIIKEDNITIEVVHAIHGYLAGMREKGIEIKENVGYIIDDGKNRLYTTSDTIGFYNDYKCNILCMPFNGNGLTLGLIDGLSFIKSINPDLVLPIHTEHPNPIMNPNIKSLKEMLTQNNINYEILDLEESIEIS
ncbi:MAG: MBL fold metallo-hydrolase [Bacilli bacterium]|nr:MBL fold metallo-hydrolase [Bacilli bacterium]